MCKTRCGRPERCWSIEPEVCEGNNAVWELYQLLDTDWHWGAGGYKSRYDRIPFMKLALKMGATQYELIDLLERLKVIEAAVLEIEMRRYQFAEEERKRKATRDALVAK